MKFKMNSLILFCLVCILIFPGVIGSHISTYALQQEKKVYRSATDYDGKGYPKGIKSDEIPIESRIIAIADAYDAMTSSRPYRIDRFCRSSV